MASKRTFRVALVRARGKNRRRLQALRKSMALVVGETQLRLAVESEGAAVACVAAAEVKGVRVKGRLVRVRKEREAITVRFESEQDAIDAATAMMDVYGVDPEIQTLRDDPSPRETGDQDCMAEIAAQFLVNPELRRSVQALHRQLERLLASSEQGRDVGELVHM